MPQCICSAMGYVAAAVVAICPVIASTPPTSARVITVVAPTPPPSVDVARFNELRSRWLDKKEQVRRLEAETYARTADLRDVEKAAQAAHEERERRSEKINRAAVQWLDERTAIDPSILDDYKSLQYFNGERYIAALLHDPQSERIMRDVVLTPRIRDRIVEQLIEAAPTQPAEQWKDDDKFWAEMKRRWITSDAHAARCIEGLIAAKGFPAFVAEQAKINGESRIDTYLCRGGYITKHTPPELKKAREDVRGLVGLLVQLWPGWPEEEERLNPGSVRSGQGTRY